METPECWYLIFSIKRKNYWTQASSFTRSSTSFSSRGSTSSGAKSKLQHHAVTTNLKRDVPANRMECRCTADLRPHSAAIVALYRAPLWQAFVSRAGPGMMEQIRSGYIRMLSNQPKALRVDVCDLAKTLGYDLLGYRCNDYIYLCGIGGWPPQSGYSAIQLRPLGYSISIGCSHWLGQSSRLPSNSTITWNSSLRQVHSSLGSAGPCAYDQG